MPNLRRVLAQLRWKLAGRAARLVGMGHALAPEGRLGVWLLGHRAYVGGKWDEVGSLQFELLKAAGLTRDDVLLDVGCGALRGGVHFIRYLDAGHYLGVDKEPFLIRAGKRELGRATFHEKRPWLRVSSEFDFSQLPLRPTFALAQSLFSHLDATDIEACLRRLRPAMASGGRFYATFYEGEEVITSGDSHSWAYFAYPAQELARLGVDAGWQPTYIGHFGHPRGQVVMRFDAQSESDAGDSALREVSPAQSEDGVRPVSP